MTLLQMNQLTKTYKEHLAVKNVSFSFEHGKCIALIGPNGAGKTTILRTLAGLLKPTSGTVSFSGLKENEDIRSLIGYLPQYPQFPSWMTAKEFLVFSGKLTHLSKKEAMSRSDELLETVGLSDVQNKQIKTFSGGMKQRLGLAQALIHKPKLLMLDEPVSSLDPIGRRDVLTLMEQLKETMTILFATHILSDAEEVCDELLLLHDGEIIESGSLETLRNKYQTTAIELEFEQHLRPDQGMLSHLTTVTNSMQSDNKFILTVTDIQKARQEILNTAAKESWPLMRFSIKRESLEDLFMKVVKK